MPLPPPSRTTRLLPAAAFSLGAGLLTATAHGALAQTLPEAAGGEVRDPAAIERRFETVPEPRSAPNGLAVPEAPTDAALPENAEALTFTLAAVTVEGAETLSVERDLAPLWADALGTEISVAELYAIADRITAVYRDAGFLLTRTVVPPQRIGEGRVTLRVIEGFVRDVAFEGEIEGLESILIGHAKAIQAARPLTNAVLERHLLLIEDLPGVRARAVLTPAEGSTGGSDLTLVVTHDDFDLSFGADNRGTEFVGPFQYTLLGRTHSVLGLYESIQGLLVSAGDGAAGAFVSDIDRELIYGQVSYTQPIGSDGLTLQFDLSGSESHPGDALEPFDINGNAYGAALTVSYPVIRARTENLSVRGALAWRHSQSDFFDDDVIDQEDRLRIARLGITYDVLDGLDGVSLIDVELSQGLPILGASESGDPRLSRGDGQPDFTKLSLTAQRLQLLPAGFSMLTTVEGQYAWQPLLAGEEFAVGGSRIGRAYDPSEVTGDHGLAAVMELRYDLPLDLPHLGAPQIYAFGDVGKVWEATGDSTEETVALSAGGGVRFELFDHLSADITATKPLTRGAGTEDSYAPRVFFSLTLSD